MRELTNTGEHPVTSTARRSEGADRPSQSRSEFLRPIPLSERVALSPAEFAALCGRSPTWGYRQIYAGRIKPIADCGRLLIPRSEVDSFLARKAEYNPVPVGGGAQIKFDDTARYWGPSEKLWPELFVAPSKAATGALPRLPQGSS